LGDDWLDLVSFIGWMLLEWWRLKVGLAVPFLDLGFFSDTNGFLSEDVKDLVADLDRDLVDLAGDP